MTPVRIQRGLTPAGAWEIAFREPRAALRQHVRRLVGYEEHLTARKLRLQIPEPSVVCVIELGAPLRVMVQGDERTAQRPAGFAAGLGELFVTTEHEGRQRGVQIDLSATGARRLFRMPLSEIAGRVVSLRELLRAEHDVVAEQLEAARDWPSRLDLVEDFLARRMLDVPIDTARVDWALGRIEACRGALEIASLARDLGHSRKHLIALFRDQVGVPPKLVARLVRFQHAMTLARQATSISWADVAAAHGYCDQAHLAREVRQFTGSSPREVLQGLNDHRPGHGPR